MRGPRKNTAIRAIWHVASPHHGGGTQPRPQWWAAGLQLTSLAFHFPPFGLRHPALPGRPDRRAKARPFCRGQTHSSLVKQGRAQKASLAETETSRAGDSLSSREAALELLSLVLERKDVGLVGPGATEQGPALRGASPPVAGWGGMWEQEGHLVSFLSGLPSGME